MARIKSLYITVDDMDRAVSFYEKIFNVPASKSPRMSSFEFDNFTFLLYDPSFDGDEVIKGNNVVPAIEVENIDDSFSLVKGLGCEIIFPPQKVEKFKLFQIKDTEGNVIEFYSQN